MVFFSDICLPALPAMLPLPGEEEKEYPRKGMTNGSEQMVSDSLPDRQCDRQCDRQSDRQVDRLCDILSPVTVSRQQTVCMTMDCQL